MNHTRRLASGAVILGVIYSIVELVNPNVMLAFFALLFCYGMGFGIDMMRGQQP